MRRELTLLGLLLVSACAPDAVIKAGPTSNEAAEQDIEVDPATLDFGGLGSGESASEVVTITNVGDATLDLYGVEISDSSAFTVVGDLAGEALAPGASVELTLSYAPLGEADDGVAEIRSSDPDEPLVTVDLLGHGLLPRLELSPDPVVFDTVTVGYSDSELVSITNTGDATATLSELAVVGAGFEIASQPLLPYTLPVGERVELELRFLGTVEGEFTGDLYVRSDEPSSPRSAPLSIYVGPACEETDDFYQGPFDSTDVLFYIDRSCSMEDDAALLADSFGQIVDALYETAFDYQVIVATRDNGCYNEAIFTPTTEDAEAQFLDAVFGTSGTWTEAGLTIALNAVEEAEEGGCNAGWLREGAKTNLVLVSDEPEQSAGATSDYVEQILELAPTTTITAIAGPVPGGCYSAEPGRGYDEAAEATGGELLNLCDGDWAAWSGYLSETALGEETDTFYLDDEPVVSSLVVTLNGEPNTDWTYDAGINALVFPEDHLPEPESHLQANYVVAHECE